MQILLIRILTGKITIIKAEVMDQINFEVDNIMDEDVDEERD